MKTDQIILAEAFKIWLCMIGYRKKELHDGLTTFKNKKLRPSYVVISNNLSGSGACRQLYKEFTKHISSGQ